jgi:hypothetical protein
MTLTALLIYSQLADLFTFAVAVPHIGLEGESNPVVRALVSSVGIEGLAVLKVLAILFTVLYLSIGAHFRRRIAILGITLATLGAASNVISLSIVT